MIQRRIDVPLDDLLEKLNPIHGVARGGFGDGTGNVWAETGALADAAWMLRVGRVGEWGDCG